MPFGWGRPHHHFRANVTPNPGLLRHRRRERSERGTAGLATRPDGAVYCCDFCFFPHPFPTLPLSVQTFPLSVQTFPFISFYFPLFPESGVIKELRGIEAKKILGG